MVGGASGNRPIDVTVGSFHGLTGPITGNIAAILTHRTPGGGRHVLIERPIQAPSWTQTEVSIGMIPDSHTQSIAGTLTRTQPCDAG